jgi:hypothetical protein
MYRQQNTRCNSAAATATTENEQTPTHNIIYSTTTTTSDSILTCFRMSRQLLYSNTLQQLQHTLAHYWPDQRLFFRFFEQERQTGFGRMGKIEV